MATSQSLLIRLLAGLLALLTSGLAQAIIADSDRVLTQQWQLSMRGLESRTSNTPYQTCFEQAARQQQLPVALLQAVARGESSFNPKAVSHAGAVGLMQILWPGTAKHLGIHQRERLFEPCTNIEAGARYLRELLNRYDNNTHKALAAYNYGPGRIDRNRGSLPKGARWYSGYIHEHLQAILAGQQLGQQLPLIRFRHPFRAEAMQKAILKRYPTLPITVRKGWLRYYELVVSVAKPETHRQHLRRLKRLGLKPMND